MTLIVREARSFDDIAKGLKDVARTRVMVGFPEDTATRQSDAGGKPAEASNALLAYVHDKGSPAQNIPARPFLESGVKAAMDQIQTRLRDAGIAALEGRTGAVTGNFHAVGLLAVNSVRERITDGDFVPLKEATLAAKVTPTKRRRDYGEHPLVVTGQLRAATTYVLRTAEPGVAKT